MFVVLEGIDAAGKTTIARLLVERLREHGVDVRLAAHNSSAGMDEALAGYVDRLSALRTDAVAVPSFRLGKVHWALIRASYYAVVDHCVVTPAVEAGTVVVADGWFYKIVSRLAVSVGPPERYDSPAALLPFFDGVRRPDRTYLIDVPPETAARRRETFSRGETGPLPDAPLDSVQAFVDYQSDVRACLRELAAAGAWSVVDDPPEPEQVARDLARDVLDGLPAGGTDRRWAAAAERR